MKIAARLGGRSVAEWMEVISATEFLAWHEFFNKEVEERKREDYHAATIAYQIYRLPYEFGFKDAEAISKMLKQEDFLISCSTTPKPKPKQAEPAQDVKAAFADMIAKAKKTQ